MYDLYFVSMEIKKNFHFYKTYKLKYIFDSFNNFLNCNGDKMTHDFDRYEKNSNIKRVRVGTSKRKSNIDGSRKFQTDISRYI